MIQYDRSLARMILDKVQSKDCAGINTETYSIPDTDTRGVMDKREYTIRNAIFDFQKHNASAPVTIDTVRQSTKTYTCSLNDTAVNESSFSITVNGKPVTVYEYCPENKRSNRAAVIYVHGGSFFAGEAVSYRHPCMFLAEKADCAVFNIEYSLAPENPYPCAADECRELLHHIRRNSEQLGIDKNKLIICGDSAGGNIALTVALQKPENNYIRHIILFYPCTDLCADGELYKWAEEDFDIDDSQRELILSRLSLGRTDGKGNTALMEMLAKCYLGSIDKNIRRNPDISAVYADLSEIPECTVMTAEFDGLRPQGEYFAKRLIESGKKCRLMRFNGVSHAFLDYFGFIPQAEAAILAAAETVAEL